MAIKVLVIVDSELIRSLLTEILSSADDIQVVGTACDPLDAREKIKALNPDVLTLDIEMPRMDGITFLSNLMRLRPMPVVMVSTLTEKGADITLQAMELGAVDFVAKPKASASTLLPELTEEIHAKIRAAARAKVRAVESTKARQQPVTIAPTGPMDHRIRLIAIGASTGGTEATKEVLLALPAKMPPIVVTQHMPPGFTRSYAQRLNSLLPLTVEEFTDNGRALQEGHVYIANGSQHLRVERRGGTLYGYCDDSEPVNRHRPAVDVMFRSAGEACGNKLLAVLLTGMGSDGARAMAEARSKGANTIVQDEASSVVWGMPKAAFELGAASSMLPLARIGKTLYKLCYPDN